MPKLSDQVWAARRREVLESAFRCFGQRGYHGTTIEDVITESGLSSSVVYRYVRSKDEMIDAAITETTTLFGLMAEDLLALDPVPTPAEAFQFVIDTLDDAKAGRSYDLKRLTIQTWGAAIENTDLAAVATDTTDRVRRRLTTLASRWKRLEYIPQTMHATDAASMLILLAYGVIVDQTHLGGVSSRRALRRMRQFGV